MSDARQTSGTEERRASLAVERGLHTLTYRFDPAFALSLEAAPVVRVLAASPGIFLVPAPGETFGLLSGPGRGMVVLAEADGTLELQVAAAMPGGSLSAEVELARVEAPRPLVARGGPSRSELPEGGAEFLIRAHVSQRGDVSAGRGAWIGGPEAPGRIEGLEIRLVGGAMPLEYQVATGGRTGGWSGWFPDGAYAGSRGKAAPLIGLRIRLKEEASPRLALQAEALFLGAAPLKRSGREIELVGPSPLDPLVGLRLDLTSAATGAGEAPLPETAARTASRLRVFRRAPSDAEAA
ncbi:hypothetical protein GCM10011390_37890 [Aureimonas endophytica]|uniref:Hydrophobic W protein n=1 Tax=Aureimonas endophytica TaxID=2027858 RepID=A0A916ZUS5_9HYPH|nr:hypothetical protein [Aureimonas endophytica]GGE15214.1 hypothetical protein GCM10011390_37890 [Aureimonas endophytica]